LRASTYSPVFPYFRLTLCKARKPARKLHTHFTVSENRRGLNFHLTKTALKPPEIFPSKGHLKRQPFVIYIYTS